MISASNHWYSVHSPLWSLDFRNWSLASQEHRERSGQRALTNRLCPMFESIPYQKELEERPEFKAQMAHRSNSVLGKILLRLLRRRWLSGPAVENIDLLRNESTTRMLLEVLSNEEAVGGGRFECLLDLPTNQASHAIGVSMTAGLGVEPDQPVG